MLKKYTVHESDSQKVRHALVTGDAKLYVAEIVTVVNPVRLPELFELGGHLFNVVERKSSITGYAIERMLSQQMESANFSDYMAYWNYSHSYASEPPQSPPSAEAQLRAAIRRANHENVPVERIREIFAAEDIALVHES